MTQNKENFPFEIERIKLERLKVYGKILTVLISIGLGTFAVALINYSYQKSQLELQEKKSEAERRQGEMKYLGEFIEYALVDDINKRIRFAEYFARLTISDDLREKWRDYHDRLVKLVEERNKIEKKLEEAKDTNEKQKIAELERDLAILQQQLEPLSSTNLFNFLRGASKKQIKELQEQLVSVGYDPMKIDGIAGRHFLNAIQRFADDQGLIGEPITKLLSELKKMSELAKEDPEWFKK